MPNRTLKGLRVKHGLTQADIALKLGISEVGYRLKENGQNPFSLPEAKFISDLFNASIEEIFFGN